jgi:uncharacterized protein (TIGR00251 family)
MPLATSWIAAAPDGCSLAVKATPRASRSEIVGIDSQGLRVRLQAPPVDGKANTALVELLADALDLPRRAVAVVGGETSRLKRVRVAGLTPADVLIRLKL